MSNESNPALALSKAQMTLWLRLGELLQENREQWLKLGTQTLHRGIEETETEVAELGAAHDWQSLATLPANAFWRGLQNRIEATQAAAQTVIGNQTGFAAGYRAALSDWQHATARALSAAGNAMPLHTALQEVLQNLGTMPIAPSSETATTAVPAPTAAVSAPIKTARGATAPKSPKSPKSPRAPAKPSR